MTRTRAEWRCAECGGEVPKWAGQCPACGAWNSLREGATRSGGTPPAAITPIGDVDPGHGRPQPTGLAELDRVLGGGLVPGSVTLVGGEPGIGKSTLLLQMLASWSGPTLYVSAEERAAQVRTRAERLGAVQPHLWLTAETALGHVLAAVERLQPEVVVVDSVQTVADESVGSAPGSVVQVRECAQRLAAEARRRGVAVVLVGHVTKDGGLAGPRVLEHLVDTVLAFEGDRHHALRLLRATKHRHGPTDELGVFEMTARGLAAVPDASGLLLADRHPGVPGSVVTATLDGRRPLLVEVQALTVPVSAGAPARRSAQGLDPNRLAALLAVLERRAGVPVSGHEVYVSAVGGVRLDEPGVDLAVCLAVAGAVEGMAVPAGLVVAGEVGLGGELRQVSHAGRRLAEAARLGFHTAIAPAASPAGPAGLRVHRARTLADALAALYADLPGQPWPRAS